MTTNIINTIKAQRDAYLDSPALSQDWKHGWHAAVGHVVYTVEQEQAKGENPSAVANLLAEADGYATPTDYMPKDTPNYVLVRALADTVRQQQAALAAAWEAGRESVAADMMRPLPDNGHRVASVNPYL